MLLPIDRPAELHVEIQWTACLSVLLYISQIHFTINERFCDFNSLHLISPSIILPIFFLATIESRRRHYNFDIAYRLIDARYQQLDQLHMGLLACKQLHF